MILIFIKDSLSVIRREELEYVQDEYVWFELKNGHRSCFSSIVMLCVQAT